MKLPVLPVRSSPAGLRRCAAALVLAWAAGAGAQQLAGRTSDGQALELASLRGQVVLLFFWSTGCPVCLDKLPELRRNLAGWVGRPFVILAINQDPQRGSFAAYDAIRRQTLAPSPQMHFLWRGDAGYRDDFGPLPRQAPVSVLIDRAGREVLRVEGRIPPALWDDVAALVLN